MISALLSRREFLVSCIATSATTLLRPRVQCSTGRHAGLSHQGGHPAPRKGRDASRVPKASELKDSPDAIVAFDEVRQIPQVVDGIRCQCGCATLPGFYSLLSCYETADAMARSCHICQGQGRYAFRLHKAGKSLDEIRAAIDARFG